MEKIFYKSEYFDAKQTLFCGQVFRFRPFKDGYLVFSADKACYIETKGDVTTVESEDADYFENYFDLAADYSEINRFALSSEYPFIRKAAEYAKGIRILNQNAEEAFYSFVISQNNMIPRIKAIIERTCVSLGEKREIMGEEYYSFPESRKLALCDEDFFVKAGYGYRAAYMSELSKAASERRIDFAALGKLPTKELKKALCSLKGVGPKVADCVSLFGYHRTDSFPVDTWIEKVYREDMNGTLTDRKKISLSLSEEFGDKSGYVQQYVFYYKREN